MNRIALVLLTMLLIGCNVASHTEISIDNLKESFASKNEQEYMRQFPQKMAVFKSYFGWNTDQDRPEELYEESYQYIDYWFSLLDKKEFRGREIQIVQICENGEWQADGVNYFQDKSLDYIKDKNKYDLINQLNNEKAKSVLFFLFDSPHPSVDTEFMMHLNVDKKRLLEELLKTDLKSHEETDELNDWTGYTNNDAYFVREIDVNGDDLLDKVVSNRANQGDQLLVYLATNDGFKLDLTSTNFSADGGCQIVDIQKNTEANGFILSLAFMGGGFLQEEYYVTFHNNANWELTHTIYRTKSGNHEGAVIYECNVAQGFDMTEPDLLFKLKSIPEEEERAKRCIIKASN